MFTYGLQNKGAAAAQKYFLIEFVQLYAFGD